MSKILEKNLDGEMVRIYWKRFVGLVTDLKNRYWYDPFFRTEFNVIVLQVIFAVTLSILVAASFNYLYKDILQTLLQGITQNIKNNGTFTSQDILSSIQVVKAKNFISFFTVTILITLVFSYIIAKLTLSPARNALKSQKRFISDIAHELRTPLSVIKTNSEVALLDDGLDHRSRKVFKSNIEELDRASAIINNLLTFSSLARPGQIQFNLVDLGGIVDQAVKKLEELAKNKKIKVTARKTNPSTVLGNATALEQIAVNLIKNAINYTPPNGLVQVSVEPDYRGNIVLTVQDTGIGISQKDLMHIFEPFFRAERSRNRQSGSSGLGLTIVSELIKLHSGKIYVRSKVREGTVVTVVLPYIKDDNHTTGNGSSPQVSMDFLKKR